MQPIVIKIKNMSKDVVENGLLLSKEKDNRLMYNIICPGANVFSELFAMQPPEKINTIYISVDGGRGTQATEPILAIQGSKKEELIPFINPYQSRSNFSNIFFGGEGFVLNSDLTLLLEKFPAKTTYYLIIT